MPGPHLGPSCTTLGAGIGVGVSTEGQHYQTARDTYTFCTLTMIHIFHTYTTLAPNSAHLIFHLTGWTRADRLLLTPDKLKSERDCICSHKYTLPAQGITSSNRFYCITEQRFNTILICVINVGSCDFNCFNFNNLCNLAMHKCKLPDDDIEIWKHIGVCIT